MKKDFFSIEDLAQGRCAVINDGTLEELREVLKRAFPYDPEVVVGGTSYYFKARLPKNAWFFDESTDLPTQSVKDFLHDSKSGNELEKINAELFKNLSSSVGIEDIENNTTLDTIYTKQPHSFCETPEEKCTMNYCDENGCQNRVRHLVEERHSHYNNENGSLYKVAEQLGLNAYEFDILKRIARCRKKGQFKEDLQKIKDTVDLYLKEVEHD